MKTTRLLARDVADFTIGAALVGVGFARAMQRWWREVCEYAGRLPSP